MDMKLRGKLIGMACAVFLGMACVEKMPLPTEIYSPTGFTAGDTTYLMQNPIWDETWGFNTPMDISIAQDGHLFIADSAANRIFVLRQDGAVLSGFETLANLKNYANNPLSPIDVDIDNKMNVFYIDGSNKIYRWNQYWNDIGIAAVAVSATFVNTVNGNTVTLTPADTVAWLNTANSTEWTILDMEWSSDDDLTSILMAPHVFYDASSDINKHLDTYYNGDLSRYTALSATGGTDRYLYVTDYSQIADKDRIIRVEFARSTYIKLSSGSYDFFNDNSQYQKGSLVNFNFNDITFSFRWVYNDPGTGFPPMDENGKIDHEHWDLLDALWAHEGVFGHNVVHFGRGIGSVNIPTGIDVDYTGNIYYSQIGDHLSVHSIEAAGNFYYPPIFSDSLMHNIISMSRFADPMDVAVDQEKNIYVANTNAQEIQVFNSDGNFFKSFGTDILSAPRSVTVDDRGVIYICDSPARIIRYRLSILDDDKETTDN